MGGVCPNASENGQISPPTTVRAARRASSRPHLAAVLREGRKSANIQAGSGVIWRIPANAQAGRKSLYAGGEVGPAGSTRSRYVSAHPW